MRAASIKEVISLAGIAIATPVLALAILASARAAGVNESDFLLFALALCGAAISAINGFGRRTAKTQARSNNERKNSASLVKCS